MSKAATEQPTGKTFGSVSITGDDFHMFTTLHDTLDEERNGAEKARVERQHAILAELSEEDRALVTPAKLNVKDVSANEVFRQAIRDSTEKRDLEADAQEAGFASLREALDVAIATGPPAGEVEADGE